MTKCRGSFAQVRQINIEKMGVGGKLVILRHAECDCNTGCRRVTLWHPRPQGIELSDEFVVKAIARVRWGDGCGGPEVEIDWKHGVILDLSGCYDEVTLEIVEILGTAPDEDMLFSYGALSACCGAGAARGCATRTTALITVESGLEGAVLVPIPPFAYAVSFAVNGLDDDDFFSSSTFLLQTGGGAAAGGQIVSVTGDEVPDPWMLVNGAESILIAQTTGSPILLEAVFLIGV